MRMRLHEFGIIVAISLLTVSCELGPRSGQGLRLPHGDVPRGEVAFQELGCVNCHVVVGTESEPDHLPQEKVIVRLGGKVAHIETHGELVTSIINPSHGFTRRYDREDVSVEGKSHMSDINDTMTVKQLIDLVEFLQSKYELELNVYP